MTQITLDTKTLTSEALRQVGYALYSDAAEKGNPLVAVKAIVNEMDSRKMDTSELREMIDYTEQARARRDRRGRKVTATPFRGHDSEGNYWDWQYDACAGKRVRICIPAK